MKDESRYKQTLVHYHELTIALDRLYVISLAKPDILSPAHMQQLLQVELGSLFRTLKTHFGDEEQGGYMNEVLLERPNLAKQVAQFKQEHRHLLGGIEQLMVDVPASELEDVKNRIGQMLRRIREYKQSEDELMKTAFFEDLGDGD